VQLAHDILFFSWESITIHLFTFEVNTVHFSTEYSSLFNFK
jgi:hypothetical protein